MYAGTPAVGQLASTHKLLGRGAGCVLALPSNVFSNSVLTRCLCTEFEQPTGCRHLLIAVSILPKFVCRRVDCWGPLAAAACRAQHPELAAQELPAGSRKQPHSHGGEPGPHAARAASQRDATHRQWTAEAVQQLACVRRYRECCVSSSVFKGLATGSVPQQRLAEPVARRH